jgi:hypothetical protein
VRSLQDIHAGTGDQLALDLSDEPARSGARRPGPQGQEAVI